MRGEGRGEMREKQGVRGSCPLHLKSMSITISPFEDEEYEKVDK